MSENLTRLPCDEHPTVLIGGTLGPRGYDYPLVVAHQVQIEHWDDFTSEDVPKDGTRLDDKLNAIDNAIKEISDKVDNSGGGSGGVQLEVDSELSEDSDKPVQNKAIAQAINELRKMSVADNKQDKLPVNTSGTSSRVWVATNNHYKVSSTNGGPQLTKVGRQIGQVVFTKPVTLKPIGDPYTVDGYSYQEYSCILSTIDGVNVTEALLLPALSENGKTISSTMSYSAVLARVSELYIMTGDDGETPFVYKDYIRATLSSDKKTVTFFWTYPYYFRRVIAASAGQDSKTAKGGGPKVGIVTVNNFFQKWHHNHINSTVNKDEVSLIDYRDYLISRYVVDVVKRTDFTSVGDFSRYTNWASFHEDADTSNKPSNGFYYSFFNAQDNEEPFGETIAVRDANGHIVVEDSDDDNDFHAVNNKKLKEKLAEESAVINDIITAEVSTLNTKINSINIFRKEELLPTEQQNKAKDMRGWYRIAQTLETKPTSNIIHIQTKVIRSTANSDVTISATNLNYNIAPTLSVLSSCGNVVDKIRLVYPKAASNQSQYCYLEIHTVLSPAKTGTTPIWKENNVEPENPGRYAFSVGSAMNSSGDANWELIKPMLVSTYTGEDTLTEIDWLTTDTSGIEWSTIEYNVFDFGTSYATQVVSKLPADAANHPNTIYFVKE